jgi:hypothetical protein
VLTLISKLRKITIGICLLSPYFIYSQISAGGSSTLKFGESKNEFHYSEVLLNMNLSNEFLNTWFQFEYSKPPEIGMSINGLRKFRVDYSNGPVELSVGDIYKIWGRGLILNQFDDQSVNLDNGYRGLSFSLIDDRYTFNLISGISNINRISQDFWQNIDQESRKPNHLSKHSIFGSDLELFRGPVSVGFSFLQSRENHPINNPVTMMADSIDVIHRINGFRASTEQGSFSSYLEISNKNTLLTKSENPQYKSIFKPYNGFSFFGNINYYFTNKFLDGWSLTMEYKNYNTTKLNPSDKDNFVKNYDMNLIFTQPPTVMREHSSVFLARLIPQVNFSDEVGYQVSLVGPVKNIGYFTLNYQAASRTNIWGKTFPDNVNALLATEWDSDSSITFKPYLDKEALPFNELYIEMEGYVNNLRYQLGFGLTEKVPDYHVLYNSGQNNIWDVDEDLTDLNDNGTWDTGESFSDKYSIINEKIENKYVSAITLPTLLNYNIGNGWSIDLKYEFQRLKSGTEFLAKLSSDEFFEDLDGDGTWDMAEVFEDADSDGIWDAAEETWYDLWQSGLIPDDQLYYYDTDEDGLYSEGEYFTDTDGDNQWDAEEILYDLDGDGVWDDAENLDDLNNDGLWSKKGTYLDSTKSNFYTRNSKTGSAISKEFQNNHLISLGLGKSPYWSLSLTIESTSTYEYGPQKKSVTNPLENFMGNIIDLENKWIALELMININSNTRLDLMYGTQRGGIICSNGICRYVEPFDDGFKLALSTVF